MRRMFGFALLTISSHLSAGLPGFLLRVNIKVKKKRPVREDLKVSHAHVHLPLHWMQHPFCESHK